MQYTFTHNRMLQVADQLQLIADNYYDSTNIRSDMRKRQRLLFVNKVTKNGYERDNLNVAVLKDAVTKLLDYVDLADREGEIDTDGMRLLLNALKPTASQWEDFVTTIHLYIVDKIEKWFRDCYLNISR